LHPIDIILGTGQLRLRFERGALSSPTRKPRSFAVWRDQQFLPLVETLLLCRDRGVAGLASGGIIDGRWVPPVEWFLPQHRYGAMHADFGAAVAWIEAEARAGSEAPHRAAFLDALRTADVPRLRGLVQTSRNIVKMHGRAEEQAAPSFLALLTEAEFLERVSTVYAYRRLEERHVVAMGIDPRRQTVLEVDRSWADPHFPSLNRPLPQEVWDSLVEKVRVVPLLAVSRDVPNPLSAMLSKCDVVARWIGVHDDQPFVYLQPESAPLPSRGFLRLHHAGDNVLMDRKRVFTSFAGSHPALTRWLEAPLTPEHFEHNAHPRESLEDAILATRGVFAVQGPPGTGKTHLATEVVRRLLARTPGARILVCSKEHFALDHIVRKITAALTEDGLPFRAWRSLSLAKQRRSGGQVDRTWSSPKVTADLGSREWAESAGEWIRWQAATSEQQDLRLVTLGQQSTSLFFATTMDASLIESLGTESFDLVIVEEAGKCYPSELLHALCLGRTSLMIGDQNQLPPYQEKRTREGADAWRHAIRRARADHRQRDALRARFGSVFSPLEALADARGPLTEEELAWLRPFEFLFDRLRTRHRLDEQFRMEAPLSRAIGRVFYGRPFDHRKSELVEQGLLLTRPLFDVVPEELDVPMLWIDTPHMTDEPDATEDQSKRGVRDNAYEAEVVLAYLRRLRPGPSIDIVILTPYNAQKKLLLEHAELRETCARLTEVPFEHLVRTTDEYQGREAEMTVLSLVRNNSQGARAWGFMIELERLNVMFSRTRFRQVVVGCGAHIERHAESCPWLHAFWQAYLEEARDPKHARVLSAREVVRG
jgi:hypothetical protein